MDNSIEELAQRVRSFIAADDLRLIKNCLNPLSIENRKQVVNFKIIGSSSLLKACELQRHDIVRYLVEDSGGDVNLTAENGISPIYLACTLGDIELLEYLYNHGGYIHKTYDEKTLLMTFIRDPSVSNYLLTHGVSVQAYDSEEKSALDYAIETYSLRSIELLIQYGADVNLPNPAGQTPISIACSTGNVEVLEFLINKGADVHFTDKVGRTFLMLFLENIDICRFLIEGGIDVNTKDKDQRTALHHAIKKQAEYNIIDFLINSGASIDERDTFGWTPAVFAIDRGDTKVLECLLKRGINVNNAVNENGSTLLHYAVERSHFDSFRLLIANDCKTRLRDNHGKDALQTAAMRCDCKDIFDFFIKRPDLEEGRRIDLYELMASTYFTVDECEEGRRHLLSALALREQNHVNLKAKTDLNSLFPNHCEPQTLNEVTNMQLDYQSLLVQAIIIRGRILGAYDPSLINLLKSYTSNPIQADLDIQVQRYIIAIAVKSYGPRSDSVIEFEGILVRELENIEKGPKSVSIILEVFEDFCWHVRSLVYEEDEGLLETLFQYCTLIAYLLLVEYEDKSHINRLHIHSKITEMMSLCPDDLKPKLVHFLLFEIKLSLYDRKYVPEAFLTFLRLLLLNNIAVNSVDGYSRRTPLHSYLRYIQNEDIYFKEDGTYKEVTEKTIHLLLMNGNHMCIEDRDGDTILELLEERGYPVCRVRDRTLQCLSAEVITKHNISYTDIIPNLTAFIKLHERRQLDCRKSHCYGGYASPSSSSSSSFSSSSSSSSFSSSP